MRKRILSLLLAIVLLFTAACPVAFARGTTYDSGVSTLAVDGNPTKCGEAGIELIKEFESCRLTAYKAVETERYWTIGWGHYGPDVTEGMTITQEEADEMFLTEIVEYENYVNNFLNKNNISVNQSQYDALVSFTYNLGNVWVSYTGNFRLRNYLIAGIENYPDEEIRDAFVAWNTAGGVVLAGLTRRRNAECDLFLSKSERPSEPWLKSNKTVVKKGEDMEFTFGAEGADKYTLIAHKVGSGAEEVLNTDAGKGSCTVSFTQSGLMKVYVQCKNSSGHVDSAVITILVYEDLGPQFTTTIRNKEWDGYLEGSDNGLCTADESGYADQMWYFERQTDGTYTVSSCYDGEYLMISGGTIKLGDAAGDWYVWHESRGYILRETSTGRVLCLKDKVLAADYSGSKDQVWEFDINEEITPQKPQLNVIPGNNVFETIIELNYGYGARGHTLLIWENEITDSEPYLEIQGADALIEQQLPLGTYQGYAVAYHEYGARKSEIITFTVTDDAIVKFNANGGINAPVQQQKTDSALKLSPSIPTRAGYAFKQWNTAADGTGKGYAPGEMYTGSTSVMLYAIWEPVSELVGDVNSDTFISNIDLLMLVRYIVGIDTLPKQENGDMNGDGELTNSDVVMLARVIVGL